MAISGRNTLVIMSDEHSRKVLGCYGNAAVLTPELDRLAADGVLFGNAYCNSPICVPSRASMITGRYAHEVGSWDNAFPYEGTPQGWAHRITAAGLICDSIGKLHFRKSGGNGFRNEIMPLHVVEGRGDVQGLLRRNPPERGAIRKLAEEAGEGASPYHQYDMDIRDAACRWLGEHRDDREPWCLFVSFVCPHFPLRAPAEFFRLYDPASLPFPPLRHGLDHPVMQRLREVQNYDDYFRDEAHIRVALAAYYGMVSFVDRNVGMVLEALEAAGLRDRTNVVYTSDHGDNLGARNLWSKCTMYEEAAGVPLIMRGPDFRPGARCATPVSLVDLYPTILASMGLEADPGIPGGSLIDIAAGAEADRDVFCEYHAIGSVTGIFMIRFGDYKYVHHDGYAPQLFDLAADPAEANDLGADPRYADIRAEGERRLRAVCDPHRVTDEAFRAQEARIAELGGEAAIRALGGFGYSPPPERAAGGLH
jgi:choline-sulfatase